MYIPRLSLPALRPRADPTIVSSPVPQDDLRGGHDHNPFPHATHQDTPILASGSPPDLLLPPPPTKHAPPNHQAPILHFKKQAQTGVHKRAYTMHDQNTTIGAVVGVLLALFLAGAIYFVYRYRGSIRVRRRSVSTAATSRGGASGRGSRRSSKGSSTVSQSHSQGESQSASASAAAGG